MVKTLIKRIKKEYLFAIYCASIMAMNILAVKQIDVFGLAVTCGIFVSGFLFIAQDYTTEIYGKKTSKKMVVSCYLLSLMMTLLYQFCINLQGSDFWMFQEEFETILHTTTRITVASFIAYMTGSMINVYLMGRIKERTNKSLFFRALTSTFIGQLLDNSLFAFIAFLGILPINAIVEIIACGLILEVLIEILCFPILKMLVKGAKVNG